MIPKRKKLEGRVKLEERFKRDGYVSFPQARKFLSRIGIKEKATAFRIFSRLRNAVFIRVWNPGTILYLNKIKIGDPGKNILIAKYNNKLKSQKWMNIAFCSYIATKDEDYAEMVSILKRKDYKYSPNFPPLLNEYHIKVEEKERYIFWAEESDNPQEDLQELMPELQEDQE